MFPTLSKKQIINQSKLDASQVSFSTKFNMALDAVDDPARVLAMEVPSSTAIEEHDWLGTVPGLSEWLDERKMDNLRAENIRIVNKDWASGIRINMNDIADDRLGIIMPKIGMLARKAALHYGQLLVDALVNGFSTGSEYGTAYDGAAFFSASHVDGDVTQSNTGTNAALSDTAYFASRAQMMSLTDEQGDPLGIVPTHLVVGPSLEKTALQITKAAFIAESNAGVSNVAAFSEQTAQVIVSPRLVGAHATKWFMADLSQEVKPLILQVREPISSAMVGEEGLPAFKSKQLYFGAQARHNVGYGLWQHIYGNQGA